MQKTHHFQVEFTEIMFREAKGKLVVRIKAPTRDQGSKVALQPWAWRVFSCQKSLTWMSSKQIHRDDKSLCPRLKYGSVSQRRRKEIIFSTFTPIRLAVTSETKKFARFIEGNIPSQIFLRIDSRILTFLTECLSLQSQVDFFQFYLQKIH